MSILLHIDSSPMGAGSVSRRLTGEFARRWRAAHPGGKIIYRDLAAMEIPPVSAAWVAANYTPAEARTPQQNELLALSSRLAAELLEASEYAIGVPMHNWGPSASFKLWADQIVHFGKTMLLTSSGMQGGLQGKRATFFLTAGRRYHAGSENASRNHLEPWLRTFFGNLGVSDMQFVFVDGTVLVKNGKMDLNTFLAPYLEAMPAGATRV